MSRMKYCLGMFMIAGILTAQSGCAAVATHAVVWGGKEVYHEIKNDHTDNE